jgi:hypothetical protein
MVHVVSSAIVAASSTATGASGTQITTISTVQVLETALF